MATLSYTLSQGKSFPLGTVIVVCFAILLGVTVRWFTNASVTAGVTATATAVSSVITFEEAVNNLSDLEGDALFHGFASVIAAYTPPPTATTLSERLDGLYDSIKFFTKKSGFWVKKHPCKSRASWGLMSKKKEILHMEWDSQHGDLEIYSNGVHLGSVPFEDPGDVKGPVMGRIKTCECK